MTLVENQSDVPKPARRQRATAKAAELVAKRGKSKPTEPAPAQASSSPAGKLGAMVDLLRRREGATLADISAATGWQAHSVRGAMSGSLKKKHKLTIVSELGEGGRRYRISA